MALTAIAVKNAKPTAKSYKLTDGGGLYLLITPKGSKLWRMKYRFAGTEKKLSFGPWPEVSMQQARDARDEARAMLRAGKDPSREKKVARLAADLASRCTFEAVAEDFIAKREADGWALATLNKNRWFLALLRRSIGKVPIAEISAPELLEALTTIQDKGLHETARRLRSFIGRVFDYAIARGVASHYPGIHLRGALITPTVKHRAAIIDPANVGKLLVAIESYDGYPSTQGALRLSPYVFQRPGEIRVMRWSDLNLVAGRWTILAEVTKQRRRHDVPLSRQAIAIIRSMETVSGDSEFVFPAFHTPKRPISENTVNQALARLGYKGIMTAHGFRSTASSLLNESGKWHPDLIERALAHQVGSAVRSAYNHSGYWNDRVAMMQWWADELDRLRAEACEPA
jgi:integrase